MIWVVDASVAVRWFLEEPDGEWAERVLERVIEQPGRFAVPELFAFEVLAVLERLHPEPLSAFVDGVIPILQGGVLRSPMTAELARRGHSFVEKGLTGYDAVYAALARELGGLWLTYDAKAHRAIRSENVSRLLSEGPPNGW
jgi:predicted nucleic acid-binding protein